MRRRLLLRNESGGGGGFPSEYQQVEWISTDASLGNAFINTAYTPHLGDDVYLKFSPASNAQMCPCSAGTGTYQFIAIIQGNGQSYIRAFSNSADGYAFGYGANSELEIHFYLDNGTYKTLFKNISDGTQHTYTNTTIAELDGSAINLYLFRRRNNKSIYRGKIFAFWAKDNNGNFIANYVPCYRKSDGVIGMYDTVSRSFFTSANSGTFTKGADVN